jgi:hypothetical protein
LSTNLKFPRNRLVGDLWMISSKPMLMSASQPLLAYTAYAAASGSFVFNQVLPGEYWGIVTVDPSVESKWSTRKAE